MTNRWRTALVMVAIGVASLPVALQAQSDRDDTAAWGQAGLGASTENIGGLVGVSMRKGGTLLSARASFVADNLEGGEDEAFDVAVLYGRQFGERAMRPSASAGIGYVRCEGCDDGRNASTVGLALSLEAALWPTRIAGFGVHGFGNVNSVSSFAGVALTIHLGRLR